MSAAAETQIQEELELYLSEKGVNTLFVNIVQNLLLEKPDCPVSFIVQYLLDTFPEETKGKFRVVSQEKEEEKDKKIEDSRIASKQSISANHEDSEEESEDDDDDDDVEDLPEFVPKARPGRRISVSASCLRVEANTATPTFPKSDEEKENLEGIVKKNVLCQHLDSNEVFKVVNAFEKVSIEGGVDIITQGDKVAEHYYVLGSGAAHVFINEEKLPLEYGQGDGFGELALMYNAPRAATVKAVEDCELWRLDQNTFKSILMASAMKKRTKYIDYLGKVDILQEMAEKERNALSDALYERNYQKGDTIVSQGEPGDEFFLIADGVVTIEKDGKAVGEYGEGKYFGEIALLTSKSRQATVIASSSEVKVLAVHRDVFKRVLGPLEDILSRNMESYSNWLTK